jgi:hypothetical protein
MTGDARRAYEDLWELFGEVPAEQILKKIDREWPDAADQRNILTALTLAVPSFHRDAARRAEGAREVIRLLAERFR